MRQAAALMEGKGYVLISNLRKKLETIIQIFIIKSLISYGLCRYITFLCRETKKGNTDDPQGRMKVNITITFNLEFKEIKVVIFMKFVICNYLSCIRGHFYVILGCEDAGFCGCYVFHFLDTTHVILNC